LENRVIAIKKLMEECGNEMLIQKFEALQSVIKKKGQVDLSQVRGRDIICKCDPFTFEKKHIGDCGT